MKKCKQRIIGKGQNFVVDLYVYLFKFRNIHNRQTDNDKQIGTSKEKNL